jgi:hypothetical protein
MWNREEREMKRTTTNDSLRNSPCIFIFFGIVGVWNNLSIPWLIPWDPEVNDHVNSNGPEIYDTQTDNL